MCRWHYVDIWFYFFLGRFLGDDLSGHMVCLCLRHCQTVFQSSLTYYVTTTNGWLVKFPHIFPVLCGISLSRIASLSGGE